MGVLGHISFIGSAFCLGMGRSVGGLGWAIGMDGGWWAAGILFACNELRTWEILAVVVVRMRHDACARVRFLRRCFLFFIFWLCPFLVCCFFFV